MKPSEAPSDLELQILSVLWEHEPVSVREAMKLIPDRKERAYTTVLSSFQVMENKGLVTRHREGKADFWSSAVTREDILGKQVGKLVDHGFGGKPSALLQCLLDQKMEAGEFEEIQDLIQEYARTKGEGEK